MNSIMNRILSQSNASKILVAIHLKEEGRRHLKSTFEEYLKDLPLPANAITVEAISHGMSLTVIAAMLVAIYDTLPHHASLVFVGFVQSSNLLTQRQQHLARRSIEIIVPVAEEVKVDRG